MSSSLFSSFQRNTKCEISLFADTCTRCVPIFRTLQSICFDLVGMHFQTCQNRERNIQREAFLLLYMEIKLRYILSQITNWIENTHKLDVNKI